MTDKIIELPGNLIGLEDRKKLESYGGHEISHGRATRFHWGQDAHGDPVFEIYRGGAHEKLASRIGRHRTSDEFYAHTAAGVAIVSGTLDHVMAVLDKKLARDHGETGGTPA